MYVKLSKLYDVVPLNKMYYKNDYNHISTSALHRERMMKPNNGLGSLHHMAAFPANKTAHSNLNSTVKKSMYYYIKNGDVLSIRKLVSSEVPLNDFIIDVVIEAMENYDYIKLRLCLLN